MYFDWNKFLTTGMRSTTFIPIWIVFLSTAQEAFALSSLYRVITGYKLTTSDFMPTIQNTNPRTCSQACLSSDVAGTPCVLANYNVDTNVCELYLGNASPLHSTNNAFEANIAWNILHKEGLIDKYWTVNYNIDSPSDAVENESLNSIKTAGNNVCHGLEPLWTRCKTGSTTFDHSTLVSAGITQTLEPGKECTPSGGLECRGASQNGGSCSDYTVSFQCMGIKNYLDSMLAYWSFDANYEDQSGNGYNGAGVGNAPSISNSIYAKGGGSLFLNPDGVYVKVSSLANHNWGDKMSVSVWFRRTGTDNHYSTVVGNGWWTRGSFDIRCETGSVVGSTIMTAADSNGWEYKTSFSIDTWHHAVLSYDGSVTSFYLDGNKVSGSNRDSGSILSSNQPFYFGYNDYDIRETFRGYIDEVRIYERPLDEQDVGWLLSQGEYKV